MKKHFIFIILLLIILFNHINCSENDLTRVTIEISDSFSTDSSLDKIIRILSKRFQLCEVENVTVEKKNTNSLQIEFTSSLSQLDLELLIERRGLLEFSLILDRKHTVEIMKNIDSVLSNFLASQNPLFDSISVSDNHNEYPDYDAFLQIEENGINSKKKFMREHPFFTIALVNPEGKNADAYVKIGERDSLEQMLKIWKIQEMIPEEVTFRFSANTDSDNAGINYFIMYLVNKKPELAGDIITDANAVIDPTTHNPVILLHMKKDASEKWARISTSYVNSRMALIIDGQVYMAPKIIAPITKGISVIEGIENLNKAKALAIILKSGVLPYSLKIIKVENTK